MKNNTQKRKRLVLSRTTIKILHPEKLVTVHGGNAEITDKPGSGSKELACFGAGELTNQQ